jgi:uncharacterized membrane protein
LLASTPALPDPAARNIAAIAELEREAIFATSFVMMTQNRMTRGADKRAHLDLQVNLLAEQELTAMLQMLNALCQRSGVAVTVRDSRVEELLKQTDIHKIANALDHELTNHAAGQ